jgi:benzoate 4-monooxygenase
VRPRPRPLPFLQVFIIIETTPDSATCVITFYLALNQHAQHKLQAELDEALGPMSGATAELGVAPYDIVKSLPYLEACIYEALRIHPLRYIFFSLVFFLPSLTSILGAMDRVKNFFCAGSSIGLPREAPAGGLMVSGRYYKEGSVLSVPSFTVHRDPDVWGPDAEIYR